MTGNRFKQISTQLTQRVSLCETAWQFRDLGPETTFGLSVNRGLETKTRQHSFWHRQVVNAPAAGGS
jgi:hypothetical protein